jgi:hypothetical protein
MGKSRKASVFPGDALYTVAMPPEAPSQTVSFRLRGGTLARLEERAGNGGVSLGDCARDIVTAELADEARLELERRFDSLQSELSRLRADLATTLEIVLLNVAQGLTTEDVRRFVSERMRGR